MVLSYLIVVALIALSLYNKLFLPWSYVFGCGVASALLIKIALKKQIHVALTFILIFFLLMIHVYFLSTKYTVFFGGDTYREYGASAQIYESGFVKPNIVTEESRLFRGIIKCSQWPALAYTNIFVASVTGIKLQTSFYIFASLSAILVLLLTVALVQRMGFTRCILIPGLILGMSSPWMIFWLVHPTHQTYGWILFTLFCLSLFYKFTLKNISASILLILTAGAMVITHHLTVVYTVAFLIFVLSLSCFVNQYLSKRFLTVFGVSNNLALIVILCAGAFTWWSHVGTILWPVIGNRLKAIWRTLVEMKISEAYVPPKLTPEVLNFEPILKLIQIKTTFLILLILLGFVIIFRQKVKNLSWFFVISSLLSLGFMLIIELFITRIEPYRIMMLGFPFLVVCLGYSYNKANIAGKCIKYLFIFIIFMFLWSAFLGLWGMRYVPLHLYNPQIRPFDVGEHIAPKPAMQDFFYKKICNVNILLANDDLLLILYGRPDQYDKIQRLDLKWFNEHSVIFVSWSGRINPGTYYGEPFTLQQGDILEQEILKRLKDKSIVYQDGVSCIWWW